MKESEAIMRFEIDPEISKLLPPLTAEEYGGFCISPENIHFRDMTPGVTMSYVQ